MTIEQLGSIGEFVAAIAVLLSLIYVGFQIRQNTAELRQAAFRDVFQSYSNNRRLIFAEADLADLLINAKEKSVSELSEVDRLRLDSFYAEQIWILVQLWAVRLTGSLQFSEASWHATLDVFLNDHDSVVFRDWWERYQSVFPEYFSAEFNHYLRSETS